MKPSSRVTFIRVLVAISSIVIIAGAFVGWNLSNARAAGGFPGHFFSPYTDVTLSGASLQSVTQSTGQKFYTLAFVDNGGGTCNAEWAGTIPFNQTSIYLPHLDSDISFIRSQGGDVAISFGGQAGQELALTCQDPTSLQAQYQRVIDTYHVTHLDFDIEGGSQGDATSYTRRNIALAGLQRANPGLFISFTLPAATTGLLSDSLGLISNAKAQGVTVNLVNPMAFDFGSPDSMMGQEAINSANGVFSELQQIYPNLASSQLWAMIGVTVMIGQNDSPGEVLSIQQAQQVLTFAKQVNMGELSFWEVSRDNGGCPGQTSASPTCSGLAQGTYDFINLFKSFSGGSGGPPPTPTKTPAVTPTPTHTATPTPTHTATPTPIPGIQPWDGNFHPYKIGDLVSYQNHVYKCIQAHTSEPNWDPADVPALWQFVR
ncbi:MAG: hypothetical protein M3Y81_23395 [Chloroflexota bacterium]|nr:hypothetical protein [Chloroflexota bacterium]